MSTSLCLSAYELSFLDKHQLLYIALVFPLEDKRKLRKLPFSFANDGKMQQLCYVSNHLDFKGIEDKSVISSKEKLFPLQVLITNFK